MKQPVYFFIFGISASIFISSCSKTEPTSPVNEKPSTYDFKNVDLTSQGSQISMLNELSQLSNSVNTSNALAINAQSLRRMYQNQNNPFQEASLNNSNINIKSKTMSQYAGLMESVFNSFSAASQNTHLTASNSQAGIATSSTGKSILLDKDGVAYSELIKIALESVCFHYQISSVLLDQALLASDNTLVVLNQGTEMEHLWDQAMGYFGAPTDFPNNTTNLSSWAKYSNDYDAYIGSNDKIMDAFIEGRHAISEKNMVTRDQQISIIRFELQKLIAAKAIAHLNEAIANFVLDPTSKNIELTSAYATILGFYSAGRDDAVLTGQDFDDLVLGFFSNPSGNINSIDIYGISLSEIHATKNKIVTLFPNLASIKDQL